MQLFLSDSHDPYVNLAIEQGLQQGVDEAVLLWVNDPCVIIGRNQNPYRETDFTFLAEHGILLARRTSGGGAVFQDEGNLNYSLVSGRPCTERAVGLALAVLRRLGVHASFTGRNDIVIGIDAYGSNGMGAGTGAGNGGAGANAGMSPSDEAKIGGIAECCDGRFLCHGTIMVDVDLDAMDRALRPSPLKLSTHGVQSVRSRVANLRLLDPALSMPRVIRAFEVELGREAKPIAADARALERAEMLQSRAWVFGQAPICQMTVELLLPDGLYQFDFDVRDGRIRSITISTDSCNPPDLARAASFLEGTECSPDTFLRAARAALGR